MHSNIILHLAWLVACATTGVLGINKAPSVSECKKHLSVAADTSLFQSGPGTAKAAMDWIKKGGHGTGYKLLRSQWTDPKYPDQFQQDPTESDLFWDHCSQAFAELSTGTAYVMLPKGQGTTWHAGSRWDRFEWPHLGAGVTRVVRLDPDFDEEVIQGSGAPKQPAGPVAAPGPPVAQQPPVGPLGAPGSTKPAPPKAPKAPSQPAAPGPLQPRHVGPRSITRLRRRDYASGGVAAGSALARLARAESDPLGLRWSSVG